MRIWIPSFFRVYEYETLARYLEQKAAKGWMLREKGVYGMSFERTEPRQLRFCVDIPSNLRKRGGNHDYLNSYYEMCENMGWTFVSTDMQMQIFVTEDRDIPEIHTDSQVQYEAIHSCIRPQMVLAGIYSVCLVLNSLIQLIGMVSWGKAFWIFNGLYAVSFLWDAEFFWSYRRWKRSYGQESIERNGNENTDLRRVRCRAALYFLIWILVVAGTLMIVANMEVETASWHKALLEAGGRIILLLIMSCGISVLSRKLWKKGYDRNSSLVIGMCLVWVLCVVGFGLMFDFEEWMNREEKQAEMEAVVIIEGMPITAEGLGLKTAEVAVTESSSDKDGSYAKYTVLLEGGGYLTYHFERYTGTEWPLRLWERYEGYAADDIERTAGLGDGQQYEAFEVDVGLLQADRVGGVMRLNSETGLNKYRYYIQKDVFFLLIDYTASEPFSEEQLGLIAKSMK